MKPPPFAYVRPEVLEEALVALADHGSDATVLAGGQSLIPALNFRIGAPDLLVDINSLGDLAHLTYSDDRWTIGALTRHSDLLSSSDLRARIPVLAEAAQHIGHTPIRNRGTVGGSIAHLDPAAELPAVLAALGGTVHLASARGSRTVPFHEFSLAPFTTTRRPDELVVALQIEPDARFHWACCEITRRSGDFALAGSVAGVAIQDGTAVDARVALFGVEPTPRRIPEFEAATLGGELAQLRDRLHDAHPELEIYAVDHVQHDYRRHLALAIAQTAIELATSRAMAAA